MRKGWCRPTPSPCSCKAPLNLRALQICVLNNSNLALPALHLRAAFLLLAHLVGYFFFNHYSVSILLCVIQSCHSHLSLKFERLGTPKPLPLYLHPSFIENDDSLCHTSLNQGLHPWWGRLQPAGTTSQSQIHGLNRSLSSGFIPLLLLASVFPHGLLFYLGAHDCIWQGLLIVSADFTGDWF